jgi:hypothetical protein
MLDPVLRRFIKAAPVCVAARVVLERMLRPSWLDELFRRTARRQYQSRLLFSTLVDLMGQVVLGSRRSVHEAYQQAGETCVSIAAVYQKLNGVELCLSSALVQSSAEQALAVLQGLPPEALPAPMLDGYELRIVDGNHLAGTQSRLKELRHTRSGPLPGQALVVLDPRRRLMLHVVPCEDAHAQERSLAPQLLEQVRPGELWIADRNFCTTAMLSGVVRQGACFLIRQHASTLTWEEAGPWRDKGACEAGKLAEQPVRVWDPQAGQWMDLRRVRLTLKQPTRSGETQILLLSNLPIKDASAAKVAELYRSRWQVEAAFGELTSALRCEVNTLGYPKAALFAFCLALLAYNAVSLVKHAMAATHGQQKVATEVSAYQLA